jgi:steroid 5-alpha reductase family enzyme
VLGLSTAASMRMWCVWQIGMALQKTPHMDRVWPVQVFICALSLQ